MNKQLNKGNEIAKRIIKELPPYFERRHKAELLKRKTYIAISKSN